MKVTFLVVRQTKHLFRHCPPERPQQWRGGWIETLPVEAREMREMSGKPCVWWEGLFVARGFSSQSLWYLNSSALSKGLSSSGFFLKRFPRRALLFSNRVNHQVRGRPTDIQVKPLWDINFSNCQSINTVVSNERYRTGVSVSSLWSVKSRENVTGGRVLRSEGPFFI